jgi:hypothetical protein
MAEGKSRVDLSEVFQSYSRKLLHEYREGARALPKHAYDRGPGRERAVRDFFRERLPGRYGVGEGIVIDAHGDQCDVVIYDDERTPVLSTEQSLTLWPYEAVYAVVQVKSRLTRSALAEAVSNITAFKRLKREENALVGGQGFVSGALAFFLLVTTAMLNNIQLGKLNLTHYLRFLTPAIALGPDPRLGQE